jgi:diketogulonate reductase-like aldo/keto reductase
VEENAASADIRLSQAEIARLTQAFPPNVTAGTRYPEKQLQALGI